MDLWGLTWEVRVTGSENVAVEDQAAPLDSSKQVTKARLPVGEP